MELEEIVDRVDMLIAQREFDTAFDLSLLAIKEYPDSDMSWYCAGQVKRHSNDFEAAIQYLSKAVRLASKSASNRKALAIAYQQSQQWEKAIAEFHAAIDLDPEYVSAYNSLGYTYKLMEEFEKARDWFHNAMNKISQNVLKSMRNNADSEIIKANRVFSELTFEYAMDNAMLLGSGENDVEQVLFPTGAVAEEEERTEKHRGLYWTRFETDSGVKAVMFLPNFFNTFSLRLADHPLYPHLVNNLASVYSGLGEKEQSEKYYAEAGRFFGAGQKS